MFVASGVALAVGWSLYAAWLTPEVYVGGITGTEVYTLAATMPGSSASGPMLTWLALGGLTMGGVAATLGGLRGLPRFRSDLRGGEPRRLAFVLIVGAGLLACLLPLDAWTLLVMALGLAASALAPAAVLACWSERATPQSAAGGAGAGFVAFLLLTVGGAGAQGALPEGWTSVVVAAPAAFAAPIHIVVAWLLRSRGAPPSRRPLPPGVEGLSVPLPTRPRTG